MNSAKTDHPIHEIISNRWSPRAFKDQDVSAQDLRAILEAARWSPSAFNEQPWRYIVATREDSELYQRVLKCLVPANQTWARSAPVLMLAIVKTAFTLNDAPNRVALHDLGAASVSLTVEATARGLAVHQMAGILPDVAAAEFGIPDGYVAETALAVGYEGDPQSLPENLREMETAPRTRKPLAEFVFGGTWGEGASVTRPPAANNL
jgi:nitroreductase